MSRGKRLGRILAKPTKHKEKLTSRLVHSLEVREMAVKKVIALTTEKNEDLPTMKIFEQVVDHFSKHFSMRSLKRWFDRYIEFSTFEDAPKRITHRANRVLDVDIEHALLLLKWECRLFYDELADCIFKYGSGNAYTPDQLRFALQSHESITSKRPQRIAKERNPYLEKLWKELILDNMHIIPASHFVIIDEMHLADDECDRKQGKGPSGEAANVLEFFGHGGGVGCCAVVAMSIEGTESCTPIDICTAESFVNIFENDILIHLNQEGPRSIVILDGAAVHYKPDIEALCESKSVRLLELPGHCPHLSPIEPVNHLAKAYVRRNFGKPGVERPMAHMLVDAFRACLTPEVACNLFDHVGMTVSADERSFACR